MLQRVPRSEVGTIAVKFPRQKAFGGHGAHSAIGKSIISHSLGTIKDGQLIKLEPCEDARENIAVLMRTVDKNVMIFKSPLETSTHAKYQ